MKFVKKLLGGSAFAAVLGVVFAGLLINAQFCVMRAEENDKTEELSHWHVERLKYIILLGSSIAASTALGISSWCLSRRERTRQDSAQTVEVRYDALLSPEEEEKAVQIRVTPTKSTASTTEESPSRPAPYSSFPPAAMFAH